MTNLCFVGVMIGIIYPVLSYTMIIHDNAGERDEVLFIKKLDNGAEIVVIRSSVDASQLKGLVPERTLGDMPVARLIGLHTQLRIDGQAIPLWAETFPASLANDKLPVEVHAIEVVTGDSEIALFGGHHTLPVGELVVAFSYGDWLMVHHQRVPSAPADQHTGRIRVFREGDWNMFALPQHRRRGMLLVDLTREDDGLWHVVLTHRTSDAEQRSVFRQLEGKWEFELIDRDRR